MLNPLTHSICQKHYLLIVTVFLTACQDTKAGEAIQVSSPIRQGEEDSTLKSMVDSGRSAGVQPSLWKKTRRFNSTAFGSADKEENKASTGLRCKNIFHDQAVTGVR